MTSLIYIYIYTLFAIDNINKGDDDDDDASVRLMLLLLLLGRWRIAHEVIVISSATQVTRVRTGGSI